nr:twin-arginine translocase subunit TatC [Dissulfurirhabdus thermomarina]
MRRFLLEGAVATGLATAAVYFYSPELLRFLQGHLDQRLAFFGVLEPVVALLKLSLVTALALLAPWFLWRLAGALRAVFGLSRRFAFFFLPAALVLFYGGAAFCFFVTLPFGVDFLLGYQSPHLRPVISVGKFVNFVGLFLLAFGIVFELPLVMTLLCRLRICGVETFRRYRRFAVLAIAVLAAVLTPTPDVFNMALMGVPLYLLYEVGVLVARLTGPRSA